MYSKMMATLWAIFFVFRLSVAANQCVDEDGKPVDWFVMYKLPVLKTSRQLLQRRGLSYMYITATRPSSGWILSNWSVNDTNSMLAQTLRPFYAQPAEAIQIAYNDQPPDATASSSFGHTKGVVVAGESDGFWLVHSVPRFPPTAKYQYPVSATRYGQSFLCVSLPGRAINSVGTQLMYNRPKIYKAIVSDRLAGLYPNLTLAADNVFVKSGPWTSKIVLETNNGVLFNSYAKAGAFGRELYSAWVSPDLRSDLQVEAWSNGVGELPSNCSSKYHVMDVTEVAVKLNATGITFKNSMDHSKWAVSGSNKKFVCIGDINRMAAQLLRGGGTVCFENRFVWNAYSKLVQEVQPCPRP